MIHYWKLKLKFQQPHDQYFLSYVKKTTGGVKLTPPPAGRGLKNFNLNEILNILGNIDNTNKTDHILKIPDLREFCGYCF